MTLLTQQFIGNQQIQTFTLTNIHIHHHSGRKQQPTCQFKEKLKSVPIKKFLDEKLDINKQNLCEVNNYPRKFVKNNINYNLRKRNSIAQEFK